MRTSILSRPACTFAAVLALLVVGADPAPAQASNELTL
jgi:hypothetical protein